jgi:hypothetical protein
MESTPVQQSTWMKLFRYCAGQENGGRIRDCLAWPERKWQQVVRVSSREILRKCQLWAFDDSDLILEFYPKEKEIEIKAKREAGIETQKKLKAQHKAPNNPELSAELSAELRGKGIGIGNGIGNGSVKEVTPPTNHPSVEEAIAYFKQAGSDYTTDEIRSAWHTFEATNIDGFWYFGKKRVGDWRSAMEARMADERIFQKKNSPSKNGHPDGWQDSDNELWWNESLVTLRGTLVGAKLKGDEKTASRLQEIIAKRESV